MLSLTYKYFKFCGVIALAAAKEVGCHRRHYTGDLLEEISYTCVECKLVAGRALGTHYIAVIMPVRENTELAVIVFLFALCRLFCFLIGNCLSRLAERLVARVAGAEKREREKNEKKRNNSECERVSVLHNYSSLNFSKDIRLQSRG